MKVTLSNYDVITLDALFNKSENILNNPEKFLYIKFLLIYIYKQKYMV